MGTLQILPLSRRTNSRLRYALVILLMTGGLAGVVLAQDADRIKPSTPSTFDSTLGGRNPFWPVGWRPKEKNPQVVQVERPAITNIPPEAASISSTLLGNPPIAVINGGEYVPGDLVPLVVNGVSIKARLMAVGDGFVRLRFEGRDYIVRRMR